METFLSFTVIGLSTGAIYAIAASGLVVTYTTTGVFNFAHGAVGMLAAFAWWQVRFDWGWPAPLAAFVVVGLGAPLFGIVIDRVVMSGLRGTAEQTRLVVTVGFLLALIGGVNWIWSPDVARPYRRLFDGNDVDLGSVTLTWHELVVLGVAVVVAITLRFLLYRTRTGVAMRATVDDTDLAELTGARSAAVSAAAWALGSTLAAVAGILIAPNTALNATALALLIVNAYAAAMFGRLRSLSLTFVGAMLLGLVEAYSIGYLPKTAYWGTFRTAVPMLLLFAVLWTARSGRLRTTVEQQTRERYGVPTNRQGVIGAVAVVVLSLAALPMLGTSDTLDLGRMLVGALVALSFVPLLGYAGQVSLCQLSFAAIGALTMARFGDGGSPVGLLAAAVVAAAVGALVALPALRLSGLSLALATGAFAVALDRWVFTLPPFSLGGVDLDLFGNGSVSVDRLRLGGIDTDSPDAQVVLLSIVLAVGIVGVVRLRNTRTGKRLVAMRASEVACATVGMDLVARKVGVFALSAAMAGVAGALWAGHATAVSAEQFSFVAGLPYFLLTTVGGVMLVSGAVFAGVALSMLDVISGIAPSLADLMVVMPGLIGIGVGRNPSGVSTQISEQLADLRADRFLSLVALVGCAAVWALGATGTIRGWWVVGGVLIVVWLVNGVAGRGARRRAVASGPSPERSHDPGRVDWELLGLAGPPVSVHHVAVLDEQLDVARSLEVSR